jgi:hypothetical protein
VAKETQARILVTATLTVVMVENFFFRCSILTFKYGCLQIYWYHRALNIRDRKVFSTPRCGRGNPSSNPGHGNTECYHGRVLSFLDVQYKHFNNGCLQICWYHQALNSCDIVFSNPRCGQGNPGSNPGHGNTQCCNGGELYFLDVQY